MKNMVANKKYNIWLIVGFSMAIVFLSGGVYL